MFLQKNVNVTFFFLHFSIYLQEIGDNVIAWTAKKRKAVTVKICILVVNVIIIRCK